MKIAEIAMDGKRVAVVRTEHGLIPVGDLIQILGAAESTSVGDIIGNEKHALELRRIVKGDLREATPLDEKSVKFLSPVGYPEKIICVGLNYRSHALETGKEIPKYPTIFSKFNNSISAHGQDITIPDSVKKVDYEGELGIVIGKTARDVKEEDALSHVYGYFIANDVSARDMQYVTSQWLMGKTIDGFFSTGPYITTADEIPDPQDLTITTKLNGEVRQHSSTKNMIFSCSFLISYLSRYMTLKPGDVISTGTPEGVILGFPPEKQVWVKNGDEVEVQIQNLGELRNRFLSR